jgi:glycerate-2-kinase
MVVNGGGEGVVNVGGNCRGGRWLLLWWVVFMFGEPWNR